MQKLFNIIVSRFGDKWKKNIRKVKLYYLDCGKAGRILHYFSTEPRPNRHICPAEQISSKSSFFFLLKIFNTVLVTELDGVGPVYNRPSID